MDGQPLTVHPLGGSAFALIELLMVMAVLAVLAGALVPEIAVRVDSHRESATRAEMERLVVAIRGDPRSGQPGYITHMGRLPVGNQLDELGVQGSQATHVIGLGGVGMGWAGPYISASVAGGDWRRDGWDRPYQFSSTTGQITSAGRDGRFATDDDLMLPDEPIEYEGSVSAIVRADDALVPGTTTTLEATTARAYAYYPVDGVETVLELVWTGAAFVPPGGQAFPMGARAIRVVGQDGGGLGDYSGRETVVTAALHAANATAEVYLPGDSPAGGSGDGDNDGVADGGDVAPANPNLCRDTDGDGCDDCTYTGADGSGGDPANDGPDADGDGICDASDDTDGDGVTDANDLCPNTPPATAVDPATGCLVDQLVPCAGPFGSSEPWPNHGEYVASVTQTAQDFVDRGLITMAEKSALVVAAGQSSCGGGPSGGGHGP